MGRAEFAAEKIPVLLSPDARGEVVARQVRLRGITFEITCVSYGNPHCVTFSPQAAENFGLLGEAAENAPFFPRRANAEFVTIVGAADFFVRVFGRGSGETFGCGSGACAVAAAAVKNGYARENENIRIRMRGGNLTVKITRENTYLTGEAVLSFVGETEI